MCVCTRAHTQSLKGLFLSTCHILQTSKKPHLSGAVTSLWFFHRKLSRNISAQCCSASGVPNFPAKGKDPPQTHGAVFYRGCGPCSMGTSLPALVCVPLFFEKDRDHEAGSRYTLTSGRKQHSRPNQGQCQFHVCKPCLRTDMLCHFGMCQTPLGHSFPICVISS